MAENHDSDRLMLEKRHHVEKRFKKSADMRKLVDLAKSFDLLVDSFAKLHLFKSIKKSILFKTLTSYQQSSSSITIIASFFKTIVFDSSRSKSSKVRAVNSSNLIDQLYKVLEQYKSKRAGTSVHLYAVSTTNLLSSIEESSN